MAKDVLRDAKVMINALNISQWVQEVTITTNRDEVDVTAMGAVNREFAPGIGDATITITAFQDYAASALDATLWPLASAASTFTVVVQPTSSAVSATNPSWTMTGRLYEYNPLSGGVGDANTTPITIRNAAQTGLVRAIV